MIPPDETPTTLNQGTDARRSPGLCRAGHRRNYERLGGSLALPDAIAASRDVSQRAANTLKIAHDRYLSLLTIALNHLTLGRAALYEAILTQSQIENHKSKIDLAVSGLRRASRQDQLPLALLTRAWQRFLTGPRTGPESAQSDLDEAWEIAARGPMPLFMADIHLYRARLLGRRKEEGSGGVGFAASRPPGAYSNGCQ